MVIIMVTVIGEEAQSTLGDKAFLPENISMKIWQNARILHVIPHKYFSHFLGDAPSLPLVFYA